MMLEAINLHFIKSTGLDQDCPPRSHRKEILPLVASPDFEIRLTSVDTIHLFSEMVQVE
jgi:hypothetical protein